MARSQLLRRALGLYGGASPKLFDRFGDVRAAGEVDGTPCTPGPGTRVVVDTNNKISIAGNGVLFATGEAANDRVYLAEAVARAAGAVVLFKLKQTGGSFEFGLDSNTAPALSHGVRISASTGVVSIRHTSSVMAALGGYDGSDMILAVVLRTAGAFLFTKGGGLGDYWRLIWSDTVGGSANLYPAAYCANTSVVATLYRMKASGRTWLPPIGLYDTFTRADGALGTSEATGPDGQRTLVQRAWTLRTGTVGIVSGAAVATALDGGRAVCTFNTTSPSVLDCLQRGSVTRGTTGAGVVVRWTDASNYIYAVRSAANIQVIKRVAGAETTLIDTAVAEVAGTALTAVVAGDVFSVYYGNALVGTEQTITDSILLGGLRAGLIFFDTDSSVDNVLNMPLGVQGQYTGLNALAKGL